LNLELSYTTFTRQNTLKSNNLSMNEEIDMAETSLTLFTL